MCEYETHMRRVKAMLPDEGEVVIMTLTDKQFGMMAHFSSRKPIDAIQLPGLFDML